MAFGKQCGTDKSMHLKCIFNTKHCSHTVSRQYLFPPPKAVPLKYIQFRFSFLHQEEKQTHRHRSKGKNIYPVYIYILLKSLCGPNLHSSVLFKFFISGGNDCDQLQNSTSGRGGKILSKLLEDTFSSQVLQCVTPHLNNDEVETLKQ